MIIQKKYLTIAAVAMFILGLVLIFSGESVDSQREQLHKEIEQIKIDIQEVEGNAKLLEQQCLSTYQYLKQEVNELQSRKDKLQIKLDNFNSIIDINKT